MKPIRACLALASLALALSACGQKGPLYLPDSTQGEVVTRPTQTPAEVPATAAPAPEVTPPEATDPDKDKKKDGATPPK
jgi:predicted small lipoprotein YifL